MDAAREGKREGVGREAGEGHRVQEGIKKGRRVAITMLKHNIEDMKN